MGPLHLEPSLDALSVRSDVISSTNILAPLDITLFEQAEKVSWVAELYMDHPGAEFLHGVLFPTLLPPKISFLFLDHSQAHG